MNTENHQQERHFMRLTKSQRIQHMILMLSFTILVVTGLPLRYREAAASELVVRALGGMVIRGIIHRIGAIMLIGVCIYHVFWTLITDRGHDELMALMPRKKDAHDIVKQIKLYLGLSRTGPRYDRFTWIEKFEYLAMGWGSVVMITTGFVLWFENQSLLVFPKWVIDVAQVVHSYEALLAFLAIIIWHFYHVHLNPSSFPMNRAWLDGTISEHELKEYHPLEYDRLMREHATVDAPPTHAGEIAEEEESGEPEGA